MDAMQGLRPKASLQQWTTVATDLVAKRRTVRKPAAMRQLTITSAGDALASTPKIFRAHLTVPRTQLPLPGPPCDFPSKTSN
jgi:hypothetical protein